MVRIILLLSVLIPAIPGVAGAAPNADNTTAPQEVAAPPAISPTLPCDEKEAPFWVNLFKYTYWQCGSNNTSRSEVFRNFGLLVAALFGIIIAVWRAIIANKQAETAQRGHITDRFSKAVEQLGHESVSVRIGGLCALERIAEDSPNQDYQVVMAVLTNFIRHTPYAKQQRDVAAKRAKNPGASESSELIDCPDVITAIKIAQTSSLKKGEERQGYNLSLPGANLTYLRLISTDLAGAGLSGANLTGADLTSAKLVHANLTGADLTGADLTGAKLVHADLVHADLAGADLMIADLAGANLTGADLTKANLTRANLTKANLTRANLTKANLVGAVLADAKLMYAALTAANLTGAIGLEQSQINSACATVGFPPTLPEGFRPPPVIPDIDSGDDIASLTTP